MRKKVPWGRMWGGSKTLFVIILSAGIAAIFTYVLTARLNQETALQQQQMAAVQQFEESGARLDSSLSVLGDALVDRRGVDDARRDARTAITLHASHAQGLKDVVGTGNVNRYLEGLAILRRYADESRDVPAGMRTAQSHVFLMEYRVQLVALARRNIYPA